MAKMLLNTAVSDTSLGYLSLMSHTLSDQLGY